MIRRDGKPIWQRNVGRVVVADGQLGRGELITFIGDAYPDPQTPITAQPIAIDVGGSGEIRRLGGEVRAVLPPSFAASRHWLFTVPDDRLFGWPLTGADRPLAWRCWPLASTRPG